LVSAGVFEVLRRDAEDAARSAEYQPVYYEHRDRMRSYQTTARALAGIGGVLLIGGGILVLIDYAEAGAEEPQVAFSCNTEGCAGSYRGHF
jgi:hypothetical protein